MSAEPPIIDEAGNISLHGRADLDLPVYFEFTDKTTGQPVQEDCTNSKLFLEVKPGGIRRELAHDTDVAGGRRIQLTSSDVSKIKQTGKPSVEYCIRDETDPFAFIRLSGTIQITGFAK